MFEILLDFFFPRRSLRGEEGGFITADEIALLRSHPVVLDGKELQGADVRFLDRVVAAADYRSVPLLRKAIHTFKYKRIPQLSRELGDLLVAAADQLDLREAVLCPVPLHWSRRFVRGFNQAELLARRVAEKRGVEVRHILRRTRPTGHQAWRHREERFAAMHRAFRCVDPHPPRHVILVDDVFTTGATIDRCARALTVAGVERVEALVLARG